MLPPGKAVIVYHAAAGRGMGPELVAPLERRLTSAGWQVIGTLRTRYAGHAQHRLIPRVADQVDLIAVIGGDGTLREVVAGLVNLSSTIPIGIIPTGNANVVARDQGIPLQPEAAIDLIRFGRVRRLDVGTLRSDRLATGTAFFLAMVEVGFGARVVHLAHHLRSGRLKMLYRWRGDLVYMVAALKAMASAGETPFHLYCDQSAQPRRQVAAVFANTRSYAKGWSMAPDALMDDGMLDWVVRSRSSPLALLRVYMTAAKGKRLPRRLSRYGQGKQFNLRAQTPVSLQVDGDPFPSVERLEIGLVPRQLALVAP